MEERKPVVIFELVDPGEIRAFEDGLYMQIPPGLVPEGISEEEVAANTRWTQRDDGVWQLQWIPKDEAPDAI